MSVMAGTPANLPLLEVKDLNVSFFTHVGEVKAIRGVDFYVGAGETIGIVGESGSGKSVTSLAILRLLPYPGKIISGSVTFRGEDLLRKSAGGMRALRGDCISMVFQDPMTSLNPVFTIGEQIVEALAVHRKKKSAREAKMRAIEMLNLVGIPDAASRFGAYPHEFSGGMRQRAMIAMALVCEPSLLIADEPTTALDVTIQAQILEVMSDLREKIGSSIILITHDLAVVSETCSRIIVMYGGQIMEEAPVRELFENPLHPYTRGLMRCIPVHGGAARERLVPISGTPPDLLKPPSGCPFVERCGEAMKICLTHRPAFYGEDGHRAACWRLDPEAPK
ncbi:MAG: ABC transporter ATP-binding protein [Synergistaceae bacterium]|jgi:oligopeptide transport system ATP-binding protein|nr:ABC transporter ATP-binding protein [Synergistaceae bacterium]